MARDWESTFRTWAKPSSDTEAAKSENAESMIRAAIGESDALKGRNIEVFAQGSYRNNTNVRQAMSIFAFDVWTCFFPIIRRSPVCPVNRWGSRMPAIRTASLRMMSVLR